MKVLITGAGSAVSSPAWSIGAATARRFAAAGAELVLTDKDEQGLAHTLGSLGEPPPPVTLRCCDLTDPDQCDRVLGPDLGDVDVLASVAGAAIVGPFASQPFGTLRAEVELNLIAHMWLAHRVVPGMVERGRGAIVFVGSDAARVGAAGVAGYAAAKGGLMSLTRCLARELGPSGIRVNCVSPGPTTTPSRGPDMAARAAPNFADLPPLGRLGEADDVARVIAFLAGPDAGHVTGQVLSVNGGLHTV